MNEIIPSPEGLFLAGMAGGLSALLVGLVFRRGGRRIEDSAWACVVYVILAGYLASVVFAASTILGAFSVGVGFDFIVRIVRHVVLRAASR